MNSSCSAERSKRTRFISLDLSSPSTFVPTSSQARAHHHQTTLSGSYSFNSLADTLPEEIIARILKLGLESMPRNAEFKQQYQFLAVCSQISKAWSGQSRRLLWRHLSFKSRRRANRFIKWASEWNSTHLLFPFPTAILCVNYGKKGTDRLRMSTMKQLVSLVNGVTEFQMENFREPAGLNWSFLEIASLYTVKNLVIRNSFFVDQVPQPLPFPFALSLEYLELENVTSRFSTPMLLAASVTPKLSLSIDSKTYHNFDGLFELLPRLVAHVPVIHYKHNQRLAESSTLVVDVSVHAPRDNIMTVFKRAPHLDTLNLLVLPFFVADEAPTDEFFGGERPLLRKFIVGMQNRNRAGEARLEASKLLQQLSQTLKCSQRSNTLELEFLSYQPDLLEDVDGI